MDIHEDCSKRQLSKPITFVYGDKITIMQVKIQINLRFSKRKVTKSYAAGCILGWEKWHIRQKIVTFTFAFRYSRSEKFKNFWLFTRLFVSLQSNCNKEKII